MKSSETMCSGRCRGMTLLEVLIVLATILILIGAVLTAGKMLQQRAAADLTASLLEVLDTALQQYYDDFGKFPYLTVKDITGDTVADPYGRAHLEYDLGGTLPPDVFSADLPEPLAAVSSTELYYFLSRNPSSRMIANAISDSLITSKLTGGTAVVLNLPGNQTIDLPRYIDAWQMSVRYDYVSGAGFPILTSAGPDRTFDTADDITNK